MTNSEYVEKLYKNEKEIIRYFNFNQVYDYNDYSDMIQDLYLKILDLDDIDRYTFNGEPNMSFIFIVVRNMIYNINKKKTRKKYVRLENIIDFEIEEVDKYSNGECLAFVYDEIEKIDTWYDKMVIDIYIKKNKTIRQFSKESKISIHHIQPIIYNFKKRCKIEFEKEEEQYKNQI